MFHVFCLRMKVTWLLKVAKCFMGFKLNCFLRTCFRIMRTLLCQLTRWFYPYACSILLYVLQLSTVVWYCSYHHMTLTLKLTCLLGRQYFPLNSLNDVLNRPIQLWWHVILYIRRSFLRCVLAKIRRSSSMNRWAAWRHSSNILVYFRKHRIILDNRNIIACSSWFRYS